MSTAGASILGLGYLIPMAYLTWSLRFGKKVGANPFGAKGLEWEAAGSPPTTFNFDHTPEVTQEAYAYSELEEAPAHG
jgi:cytochrome c oxidase subunit 1